MRILLVEDDREIAASLKASLEEAGFSVDVARDGERGIFLGKSNEYDVIVLDNMLPKKPGIEVCRALRAAGRTAPILLLSVVAEAGTKAELLNAGADDYLAKPFLFDELLARVHALMRRPRPLQPEILTIADFTINMQTCSVTRDGVDIGLTRKEFALFAYLVRNKGEILTRNMIMEHVWDMNADPLSNSLEAHMRSLRKKIETPEKRKLIQTIIGRGYCLSEDGPKPEEAKEAAPATREELIPPQKSEEKQA